MELEILVQVLVLLISLHEAKTSFYFLPTLSENITELYGMK